MNYHDIPEYDTWTAWKNYEGNWEVKLTIMGDVVVHFVEDSDSRNYRIEEERFYLDVEHGVARNLRWIRERKGIEMPGGIVDADYVTLNQEGDLIERQHNHNHLDRDVEEGRLVCLTSI